MNSEIKNLLLEAIRYERPKCIQKVCLPIWNQPFFYKIDKARVLTISYYPTDKGARTNYPDQVAHYNKNGALDAEEIFELLYNFKKENYWRKNYDILFNTLGVDSENIAHMDVSIFPYRTFNDYRNNKEIDYTKIFLLKTIKLLSDRLEYIFIDGERNKEIVNLLIDDYSLIDSTLLPINSGASHKLHIYKHKTFSTFLIYYECFLYGRTCPSEFYVKKIADYIKHIQDERSEIKKHFQGDLCNATGNLIIKCGNSPESIRPLLHINAGDECILAFDNDTCVGVIWEHNENRDSEANGQAEIRFFEKYKDIYGLWHRMFVNKRRLLYSQLQSELKTNEIIKYFTKLKK